MRLVLCLAVMFVASGARAENYTLQGHWKIAVPSVSAYSGAILIDAERRAIWDAPDDGGRPAKFQGYVAGFDGPKVEIILTDRTGVAHVHCTIQSSDLLLCYVVRSDGVISPKFALTRIGPGPNRLAPILPPRS